MRESSSDRNTVEVLAEEFVERYRQGERPPLSEYTHRYPDMAEEIEELFPAVLMLENLKPAEEDAAHTEPSQLWGTTLDHLGDYRIIREIGRGGMGIVYEAEQVSLGRHVALKVLPRELLEAPKHRSRFEREAKAAAKLHHTNIVPVFSVGHESDSGYYAMQFIQGLALNDVLDELKRLHDKSDSSIGSVPIGELRLGRRDLSATDFAQSLLAGKFQTPHGDEASAADDADVSDETHIFPPSASASDGSRENAEKDMGRLSSTLVASDSAVVLPGSDSLADRKSNRQNYWLSVARIGASVAAALEYAHGQGILHRDIKPSNLLLDIYGTVWVTDFGLAKLDDEYDLTETGDILGTLRYMAPETFQGRTDARSEIYSLGLTLYELLAFRPAFDQTTRKTLLEQVLKADVEPLEKVNREIPRDLRTIIRKSVEPDPAHRYQTAQDLAEDLQRFIEDEPIRARRISLTERFGRWSRRNKGLAASLSAVTLLLLIVAIGSTLAAGYFQNLSHDLSVAEAKAEQRAATNEQLAKRQTEQANRMKKLADERDASANLAENRAAEIRKTLYASEMHLALAALDQPGGAIHVKSLLDNWRPKDGEADLRGWEWYYLRSRLEQAEWFLPHPGSVKAAVWSADGGRVFTGCEDGVIRAWDVETGRVAATFEDHESEIVGLALTFVGDRLASLDDDGTLKIRNPHTGEVTLERKLAGGAGANVLAWSPNGSRLLAEDGTKNLLILNPESGEAISRFEQSSFVKFVDWHPDGERFAATCGLDLLIRNLATGESLRFDNQFHNSVIYNADWDAEGNVLVCGAGRFYVVDPGSGEIADHPLSTVNRIVAADVEPASGLVACAALNRGVCIYDPKTRETLANLKGHTAEIFDVSWSPDGQQLLSAAKDGARIWRFRRGDPEVVSERWGLSLQWRPNSGELAIGDYRNLVFASAPTFEPADSIAIADDLNYRAVWSDDGARLALSSGERLSVWQRDGSKPIWEANSDERLNTFIEDMAWEPGGERLIAKGGRGIEIFSAKDGVPLGRYEGSGSRRYFAWHPEGGRFAISNQNRMCIVDADTGEVVEQWKRWVRAVAWSPSGDILATARRFDFVVELWEMPGAKKIGEIGGSSLTVGCLVWSPDSKLLAIGALDNTVHIWSAELGRVVLAFRENSPVVMLDWDDSGTRLAISAKGEGGGIRIRDAGRGYLVEDSATALAWLDQNVAAEPNRLRHRIERAQLLEKLGRWELAGAEWARLAESRPGDSDFSRRRLKASLKNLDPAEAIARLETQLADGRGDCFAAGILAQFLLDEANGVDWIPLKTGRAVSEGGATLLPQPDGSILATGDNPPGDVYRVTGQPGLSRITAIRLDAIPDERLPKAGSGRAADGDFHLGDFSIESAGQRIPIMTAWADYHYLDLNSVSPEFPIAMAIDNDPDRGWDTFPKHSERHTAIFELAESFELAAGAELTIRLQTGTRGGGYPTHNLGRFRLSLANHQNAARLSEIQQQLGDGADDLNGWKLLGEVRVIRNVPEAAAEAFGKALDDTEDDDARARILSEASKDEAVFTLLMSHRSEDLAGIAKMAETLSRSGDVRQAISLVSAALSIDPESESLLLARGKARATARLWEMAAEDLARAIPPDHDQPDDFAVRAEAFEQTQQWNAAATDWQRVVEAKADEAVPMKRWMIALLHAEKWAEAVEVGQRRFEDAPYDSENWLRLGPALILSGNLEGYQKFRNELPRHIDRDDVARTERGLKAGLLIPASGKLVAGLRVAELTAALEDPDSNEANRRRLERYRHWVHVSLALASLRNENLSEAEAHAAKAIEQKKTPNHCKAIVLAVRAIIRAKQGDLTTARNYLESLEGVQRIESDDIHDWLVAEILRREAESLMNQK